MKKQDIISIAELNLALISKIIRSAISLKKKQGKRNSQPLKAQTVVLIFEKPSLRTRVTFETAMTQLGGNAIYLSADIIQPGKRESVSDIARNLERWVDGIVARTYSHSSIHELAQNARIPVINALSDDEHPCQALACIMTLQEHWKSCKGRKLVFVGDGNNVAHSLMLICPKVGMDFVICCPNNYEPDSVIFKQARQEARRSKTSVSLERNIDKAVAQASVIYTDAWTSMGMESEYKKRLRVFKPYQINDALLAKAPSECLVTHCLPAHRGEEITDSVMDGPRSICFDEAENRLHIHKALLIELLKK